ncbi:MAG: carboxylating nicotinate-nucleotide diphosphorylase [Gammaproteobacteria bacterium]|nr:carboxylating nicotinate-nucleotide diphosphorylase [Gammaproteobacteria bacterium]
MSTHELPADLASCVRRALSEDIGKGDLTAALIPTATQARAEVICREEAVLCGTAWFDEVFRQLDEEVRIDWLAADGDQIHPEQVICKLLGPARSLLSGERSALNFLQLLSGTASITRQYVGHMGKSKTRLLDTRKTVPGLRTAQKYAVACAGGYNHRMGLYDAILIKENHILAAGSITLAVQQAKTSGHPTEVEVESIDELQEAINAGADSVLLDNFSPEKLLEAVALNAGKVKLEVSGGIEIDRLKEIAATGVDYISIGALTKHVRAVDFSMRIS